MSEDHKSITNDLKYRQICAVLIQDLGILHNVSQMLINTAIVYMHKLYEKFSYKELKPVYVAMTSFYLASKSEDCARKLSEIVKSVYQMAGKQLDNQIEKVIASVHALESIMLMSVGFPRLDFVHPHIVILKIVKNYDLPPAFNETAYYICTAMLHLTKLISRHSTEELAAAAIYVASKWDYIDLKDIDSKSWYKQISSNISVNVLKEMAYEFLEIHSKTPTRLKVKAVHFLKRFNKSSHNSNINNSQSSQSSSASQSNQLAAPTVTTEKKEPEKVLTKAEQLEDGEIDQIEEGDGSNPESNVHTKKTLSLDQYLKRKESTDTKSFSQPNERKRKTSDSFRRSQTNHPKVHKSDYHNRKYPSENNLSSHNVSNPNHREQSYPYQSKHSNRSPDNISSSSFQHHT